MGLMVLWVVCSMLSSLVWAADADYRLGPGDLLRVNVFGSPELSGEVRISESGNITYQGSFLDDRRTRQ